MKTASKKTQNNYINTHQGKKETYCDDYQIDNIIYSNSRSKEVVKNKDYTKMNLSYIKKTIQNKDQKHSSA